VLTVADLADDAVVQIADERGVERPRPIGAGGALRNAINLSWSAATRWTTFPQVNRYDAKLKLTSLGW
jgi:hypothetical protein